MHISGFCNNGLNQPGKILSRNFVSNQLTERAGIGITVSDVASFLDLGVSESELPQSEIDLIQSFIDVAIEKCLRFTSYEPTEVEYEFRYDEHPQKVGYHGGAGPIFQVNQDWVELPKYPVKSIDSIEISGETISEDSFYVDLHSKPARVFIISGSYTLNNDFSQIKINATCGDSEPKKSFLTSVKMVAAYLYNNRTCDFSGKSLMKSSGAYNLLLGMKVKRGGL